MQTSFGEPPNSRYVLLGRETETEAEIPRLTERDKETERQRLREIGRGGERETGTQREKKKQTEQDPLYKQQINKLQTNDERNRPKIT